MSAPSLYRRHRPRTFEDVVGQDHVVRTLRNAVEQGKVHHAYLFVGSRGTGKTSMAKILASCLDCEHGPTAQPCGVCESCLSIQRATSLDVVEMDAASNNSVDDVRELRDRVQTAPSGGRWRVYILDEAHMLTTQAWNALLKTLEEPPPQTVFVLATTEAHKVLPTVVDRTHRFDFTRPTGEQISRVLARVADKEGLTVTDGALGLVARNANGSFRDALGTLEQLVTYAGSSVNEDDAVTVLGIGDDAELFGAIDAVIDRDPARVLRVVQEVAAHGRDLGSYARELERHARDLLVCCILGGVPPEVRLTADRDALLDGQARRIGRDQATHLLELMADALTATRDGADGRAMLELALVKAADPSIDPALRALQSRLARLEERLAGGAAPSPAPATTPASADQSREPEAHRPDAGLHAVPAAPPETDRPVPTAVADLPASPQPTAPQPGPPAEPLRAVPEPLAGVPHAVAPPAPPAPAPPHQREGPQYEREPVNPQHEQQPVAAIPPAAAPPVAVPEPPGPAPSGLGPSLADVVAVWGGVLDNLRGRDQLCAVALERARPVDLDGTELTIAFPTDAAFYRGTADREERRLALREALREVTGATLSARFELRDLTAPIADSSGPELGLGSASAASAPVPAPPASGPQGAASPQPSAPMAAPPLGSTATLDESAVVAHLVTEFDAEEIADPDQEPS